jgi:hypothetical protein
MTDRFDYDSERKELRKLINRYQERADRYEYEYQVDGNPSHERAWMRNQRLADALRTALSGKDDKYGLTDLRIRVMELDTRNLLKLQSQVKALQKSIGGTL